MKAKDMLKKQMRLIASLTITVFAKSAIGVCPVCAVAAGAGVGLAHKFGIDDSITGLWIGGLILSIGLWTVDFLNRHSIKFFCKRLIVPALYYLLVAGSLYRSGFFAKQHGTLFGINKLAFGIILGSFVFMVGTCWSNYLKKQNNGHVRFAYQKIVIPIGLLILFSLILCCITK